MKLSNLVESLTTNTKVRVIRKENEIAVPMTASVDASVLNLLKIAKKPTAAMMMSPLNSHSMVIACVTKRKFAFCTLTR